MSRTRAYTISCSQVFLVYLHPLRRNSLFCSRKWQKSLKTPFLEFKVTETHMDVDTTKSASPAAVFDLTGVLGGLTPHCMRTTSPLELVWGSSLTPTFRSVSASGGFASTFLTRGSTLELCWGAVYRGLTVAFGGLQLSSAGTDQENLCTCVNFLTRVNSLTR